MGWPSLIVRNLGVERGCIPARFIGNLRFSLVKGAISFTFCTHFRGGGIMARQGSLLLITSVPGIANGPSLKKNPLSSSALQIDHDMCGRPPVM